LDQILVEAPGSSANLGPGFDVFALALESPTDRVRLVAGMSGPPSVKVGKVTGLSVPKVTRYNGAAVVASEMAKELGVTREILMELDKRVPIGRGMGSSGASAAAAAYAMNELFDLGLSTDDIIYYAGMGEGVTSGSRHYDNVSASVLGGFVVVRGGERPAAVRYDPPQRLAVCLATPIMDVPRRKTEYARSLLPSKVPLSSFVANLSNATTMVVGMANKDLSLIGKGMVDKIVEPARKKMIPGYDSVRSMALQAGAEGVCISGAGPSMLAIVDKKKVDPKKVLRSMTAGFKEGGVSSRGYVTRVGEGARVVKGS
jgi:homoserine kinase